MGGENNRAVSLLLRHYAQLYGYLFAALGNHTDTEDALQEVSLTVAKKIDLLDDDRNFLVWAREIARREVLALRRSFARLPGNLEPALLDALAEAATELDFETDWGRRHEALTQCLETLPPESKTLIQVRYGEGGVEVPDLARQLNRTVQATYGMLKRIRQALRECVERKLLGARS